MTTTAERYRTYRGPALFSMGFRPFFLFAAAWAALAIPIWIGAYAGQRMARRAVHAEQRVRLVERAIQRFP